MILQSFPHVLMLSGIPIIATLQNDYLGDKILKARKRDDVRAAEQQCCCQSLPSILSA